MDYLRSTDDRFETVYSKNLLEHLPNPGVFLAGCYSILKHGGRAIVITDNAEFMPFYLPFWVKHIGVGAHAVNAYALNHCDSVHYAVFTKMHLANLMSDAGFKDTSVRRVFYGARLQAVGTRP